MAGIPLKITMIETQPPDVSARKWREFSREAHREQGLHWHAHLLPLHFTPQARFRYGHQPRAAKTRERKRKAAAAGKARDGGLIDNVWTGLLRQSLQSVATVRAFPSRVSIQMLGPRYITMRPFKSNQPDKAAEITAVTDDERRTLERILSEGITRRLAAYRETRVTRHD